MNDHIDDIVDGRQMKRSCARVPVPSSLRSGWRRCQCHLCLPHGATSAVGPPRCRREASYARSGSNINTFVTTQSVPGQLRLALNSFMRAVPWRASPASGRGMYSSALSDQRPHAPQSQAIGPDRRPTTSYLCPTPGIVVAARI